MKARTVIHTLRIISSFALLGAVVTGSLLGWVDDSWGDVRAYGAAFGGIAATVAKITNVI